MFGFRGFKRGAPKKRTEVTYNVDIDNSYTERVSQGISILTPHTFTPTKSGYSFVGWREDNVASSAVLVEKVAEGSSIVLYAVFTAEVTVSYDGNGSDSGTTAPQVNNKYYNNGNILNASFILSSCGFEKTDYHFNKWRLNSTSGTAYDAGDAFSTNEDSTFFVEWAANEIVVISESAIIDTEHVALTSCTPYAYATCNPDWYGTGSTEIRECYAVAGGEYVDYNEDYHQTCLTNIAINIKPEYIGRTCTMTYSLNISGRWGGSGVGVSATNGTQTLISYNPEYMWSGSYVVTRTDTFTINNGTITLVANYDKNSNKWGAGASCEVKELIIR